MKTYEIDYSAPVALIKRNCIDKYPVASVYKVKRYASFVIIPRHGETEFGGLHLGDIEQVNAYVRNRNLYMVVKNARGRKYFKDIRNS